LRHISREIVVPTLRTRSTAAVARDAVKRALDVGLAATLLILLAPVVIAIAVGVKLDSRGPVLYRSRRIGRQGVEFAMLKFRKMYDGAVGPALTATDDARFTRFGRLLARTKLDEIPQLFNVLKGEMSLVGPRPEDPSFVDLESMKYREILGVRPGITGLSQLAFAKESEILNPDDPVGHYITVIFPQKLALDALYASKQSANMDMAILAWTVFAVVTRRDVAVNRVNGTLTRRRSPVRDAAVEPSRAA
jgi:lipopolysaccharide/colanic/teichoic acid biosynthesis glycosyltransferase